MKNYEVAGLALLLFCVFPSFAADQFPSKPVRMVVPFAPAGISDVLARAIVDRMTDVLGQSVIVDNRAGASGNIGTRIVARAIGDGYTLLFTSPAFATNINLFSDAGYDPVKDFSSVSQVASATNLLVVTPQIGVSSARQFIDAARKSPGTFNYGSGGAGTSGQLAAELFQIASSVELTHVPYKGAGPALTALLGNEVQIMFSPVALVLPHVTSGRLKALAVTSGVRSRVIPDVPTIAESAIPGFDVSSWFGVVAPSSTPISKIRLLSSSISEALRVPAISGRLLALGADPVANGAEEFGTYIRSEVIKWGRVIKEARIKKQ